MLGLAAVPLGYRIAIFAPDAELVAADVASTVVRASYDDRDALLAFAAACDVITYEFENVPADSVAFLERHAIVRPGAAALDVSQDRLSEKRFIQSLGGSPAPFRAVDNLEELHAAVAELGLPAILKTRRFGYDGKGQARIAAETDIAPAFAELGGRGLILEAFVRYEAEFSIVAARGANGWRSAYPACHNVHEQGILAETRVPLPAALMAQVETATALVSRIADALSYVGVLTCEFFATADGPVFNEMAPRVHNSGHWTIEGARTSQFEQHVRAVCGLPPGSVALSARQVEMRNLLGADIERWAEILADPAAHLHLYGKSDAVPGRKMGHVTRLIEG